MGNQNLTDMSYGSASSSQKLDLYYPSAGSGPFPLVIFIHGGAFRFGDKAFPMDIQTFSILLPTGIAVASINYRLSSEALFPAQIQDVRTATRFLRQNAARYNLDPNRFGVWGPSAGGNLAALLGLTGNQKVFEEDLSEDNPVSCQVSAVVDWFGPTDFLKMDRLLAQGGCTGTPQLHDPADSPESLLLGGPIQEKVELAKAANPITYVNLNSPPFLIAHGIADCLVPYQGSQELYEALLPLVGPGNVEVVLLEGAGHGGPAFMNPELLRKVAQFFERNLA